MQLLFYATQLNDIPEIFVSREFPEPDWDDMDSIENAYPAIEELSKSYLQAHNIQIPTDYSLTWLLQAMEKQEDEDTQFIWYAKFDDTAVEKISLDKFFPVRLSLEEILEQFDLWHQQMRDSIRAAYLNGNMPIGKTIEFSDELYYLTEIPGGLTDKQAKYLNPRTCMVPSKNRRDPDDLYEGVIEITI